MKCRKHVCISQQALVPKYHRHNLEIYWALGFKKRAACLAVAAWAVTSAAGYQNDWSVPGFEVWVDQYFTNIHSSLCTIKLVWRDAQNMRRMITSDALYNWEAHQNEISGCLNHGMLNSCKLRFLQLHPERCQHFLAELFCHPAFSSKVYIGQSNASSCTLLMNSINSIPQL